MLLGTLMRQLRDEGKAEDLLLSFADIVLLAEIEAVREPFGESLGEYVSGAAQRFAAVAGSEEWLQLMTRIEKSDEPAEACLQFMVRWAVKADQAETQEAQSPGACGCGGNHGKMHGHAA